MPEGKRRIGDEVFCVDRAGVIMRTAVKEVGLEGRYSLLHETGSQHFLGIDEALGGSEAILKELLKSDDITKRQEADIAERLRNLRTEETRTAILSQELEMGSQLHGIVPKRGLDPATVFPSEYLEPGTDVFGIVTPDTHNTMSPAWRPHPYFILATRVLSVSFSPVRPGGLYYRLEGTWYSFASDRLFAAEEDARKGVVAVFEEETSGTILPERVRVIPAGEEMGRMKATVDTIISADIRETEDITPE